MYTLSPKTMKYADRLATEEYSIPEKVLMENAARACFDLMLPLLTDKDKTIILCGKGNNGGDGYLLASLFDSAGCDVTAINVFDCEPDTEPALSVYKDCLDKKIVIAAFSEWKTLISSATVIVDALFGVGFHGSIDKSSEIGKMLTECNSADALRYAIDTPSGIDSLNGRCDGIAFRAHTTITMAFPKTGMLSYPAREFCGDIKTVDIGYPKELCDKIEKDAFTPDDEYVKRILPTRKPNTHKGNYGRLLMYCGSYNMTGAAVLSATAALRAGCGLVNIARDKQTLDILKSHLTEPIFSEISGDNKVHEVTALCEKATAALIGCGLGKDNGDRDVLFTLIKNADCNLIIDADGINLLCENINILKEAKKVVVLTPHPLEFARLIGKSVSEVQADRLSLARDFAKQYGCVVLLKGANSIIAGPDGTTSINTTGNPGLSKGGSGDVLAGIVASFTAQGISPFDSAVLGAYLHGKAADILKDRISEYGLLPSDLPMAVAQLLP